jgi:glutathione S-transferase
MLTVYYHPLSTFSQRVRIALLEKSIPAELAEIDLPARAQFRPEYLSKNPYGRVPAIEEDGWVLYESTAILEVTPGPATLAWAGRIAERPSVRRTKPAR